MSNVNIFNNKRNFKSNVIQLMVQNYLTIKYNDKNIFFYPELINDIDVFAKDIKGYEELVKENGGIDDRITIRAFLDEIDDDIYRKSIEVKSGISSSPELTYFVNLKHLLDKCFYPDNTELMLILVPTNHKFMGEFISTTKFDELRNKIFNLSDADKYKIMNAFKNDTSLESQDINSALISLLGKLKKKTLRTDYGDKNIPDEENKKLLHNISKVVIKILTVDELEKYPISGEFLHELLSSIE